MSMITRAEEEGFIVNETPGLWESVVGRVREGEEEDPGERLKILVGR
jgi:hypothetical protein